VRCVLADLGDSGEVLRYLAGFWSFVFSPKRRGEALRAWRQASGSSRALMTLEAAGATIFGVGVPLIVVWFIVREWR